MRKPYLSILISFTLLAFILMIEIFIIKRYLPFASLDVVSGCKMTECEYTFSFQFGLNFGSGEKNREILSSHKPIFWDIDRRIGTGNFTTYFTSDLDWIGNCLLISYAGPGISYSYTREFKPTNIYNYFQKSYVLIDQTMTDCRF